MLSKKNLNRPEEFNGYEKWKEATHIFLQLKKTFPNRVYIQKYFDLLRNPFKESETMFRFLNLEFAEQTKNFLSDSTTLERENAYSVFRKKQNDDKWRVELEPVIAEKILIDLRGTPLEVFL